jgi:hypothetical protein
MATTSETKNVTDAMDQFAEMVPQREALLPEIKEATEFAECCLGQLQDFFLDDSWKDSDVREETIEAMDCAKACANVFLHNRSFSEWIVNDTRYWTMQDADQDLNTDLYLKHVDHVSKEYIYDRTACTKILL